jgi:hypothetical protein
MEQTSQEPPQGKPESKRRGISFVQLTGLVTVLATAIGIFSSWQQEKSRQLESQIKLREDVFQLLHQREQFELNFKTESYKILLTSVLNSKLDLRSRIATLRLFYDNAKGHFNPRVFFDVFADQADKLPNPRERRAALDDLVSFAQEIVQSEEQLIEANAKQTFASFILKKGESYNAILVSNDEAKKDTHKIHITLKSFSENAVELETDVRDDSLKDVEDFEVSYFDTPFSDYTYLRDHHRFAITLKDIQDEGKNKTAYLKIVEFPTNYFLSDDRPSIEEVDELIKNMGQTETGK